MPFRRATCNATGMRMASAPTFFVTIDSSIVAPARTGTCVRTLRSRGRMGCSTVSTTPERATPSLTTSAAATMMMISLLNPSKA